MAKSLQGFSNYELLQQGGLNVIGVCSCCGANVINEKAANVASSIIIASNLSEEQMRGCLAKPLKPDHLRSQEYCDAVNKKYTHPWEFVSVPLLEKESLSLLLQLPAKE